MASQEVLVALESLHLELNKLQPAIRHIEAAQKVISIVQAIPQKHLDLLEKIMKTDSEFKNALKKAFEEEVKIISAETKKLQETTTKIQEEVKAEQKALASLGETVRSFHERVEKINFPERLDKLDANVAGIMAAVQSVQSRLDGVERNLTDRMKDMTDYLKESVTGMYSSMEQAKTSIKEGIEIASKRNRVLSYVTWGVIVVVGVMIVGVVQFKNIVKFLTELI
jgi:chromosome segregation ATPase